MKRLPVTSVLGSLVAAAALVGIGPTSAQAAWVISLTNTPSVLTFNSDFPGVYQAVTGSGYLRALSEPDNWGRSIYNSNKDSALFTESVAEAYIPYVGGGNTTHFAADGNGNGNTTDTIAGQFVHLGEAGPSLSNAFRLSSEGDWGPSDVFFRIQNNTGQTITKWNFTSDIYYAESDPNPSHYSTLAFSYAVSNGDNPDVMTFTSFGAAPTITQGATFSTLAGTLNQTVTTTGVANGDYIVLSFADTQPGTIPGSGIDLTNIGVTAVNSIPEPASLGMGLLGLGIIALGRRRARQSV